MGLIKNIFKGIGVITGSILAVPLVVIAKTLNITTDMVKEAKDAGCETYEEIQKYFKNN